MTVFEGIFCSPGARHEGRAMWRPLVMCGRDIVAQKNKLETNRKKAMQVARDRCEELREKANLRMRGTE